MKIQFSESSYLQADGFLLSVILITVCYTLIQIFA
jgi:hypothetical protein